MIFKVRTGSVKCGPDEGRPNLTGFEFTLSLMNGSTIILRRSLFRILQTANSNSTNAKLGLD